MLSVGKLTIFTGFLKYLPKNIALITKIVKRKKCQNPFPAILGRKKGKKCLTPLSRGLRLPLGSRKNYSNCYLIFSKGKKKFLLQVKAARMNQNLLFFMCFTPYLREFWRAGFHH